MGLFLRRRHDRRKGKEMKIALILAGVVFATAAWQLIVYAALWKSHKLEGSAAACIFIACTLLYIAGTMAGPQ